MNYITVAHLNSRLQDLKTDLQSRIQVVAHQPELTQQVLTDCEDECKKLIRDFKMTSVRTFLEQPTEDTMKHLSVFQERIDTIDSNHAEFFRKLKQLLGG